MNSANRYVPISENSFLKNLFPDEFFCSYVIQHFRDTLRQSVIDLMLGNIMQRDQLQFDETLKILTQMTDLSPIDTSHFHYGALNTELQLTEAVIKSTRCEELEKKQ